MIKHFSTWTQEDKDKYIELWHKHTHLQLQRFYQCGEKTITNINKKLGLKVGMVDSQGFKVKKYAKRKDTKAVGTISIHQNHATGRPLAFITLEQGRERLHIYNWKKAGNEIPEGYLLGFKNPYILDPIERDDISNLELKTRKSVILENIKIRKTPIVIKPVIDLTEPKPKKPKKIREPKIKPEKQKVVKIKPEKKVKVIAPPKKQPVKKPVITKEKKGGRVADRPTPKRVEKVFATQHRDFSKMIPVRIDHKTIVYARTEADVPRIKQRYSRSA